MIVSRPFCRQVPEVLPLRWPRPPCCPRSAPYPSPSECVSPHRAPSWSGLLQQQCTSISSISTTPNCTILHKPTNGRHQTSIASPSPTISIFFPDYTRKSDVITLRGPCSDVDKCHSYLQKPCHDLVRLALSVTEIYGFICDLFVYYISKRCIGLYAEAK